MAQLSFKARLSSRDFSPCPLASAILVPSLSQFLILMYGPGATNNDFTWELVRNAESQATLKSYQVRIWILTRSLRSPVPIKVCFSELSRCHYGACLQCDRTPSLMHQAFTEKRTDVWKETDILWTRLVNAWSLWGETLHVILSSSNLAGGLTAFSAHK